MSNSPARRIEVKGARIETHAMRLYLQSSAVARSPENLPPSVPSADPLLIYGPVMLSTAKLPLTPWKHRG